MIKFVEHISHPGFGYIEPYMNADDPLIFKDVGERLVKVYDGLHSEIRELNNKLDTTDSGYSSGYHAGWNDAISVLEKHCNDPKR